MPIIDINSDTTEPVHSRKHATIAKVMNHTDHSSIRNATGALDPYLPALRAATPALWSVGCLQKAEKIHFSLGRRNAVSHVECRKGHHPQSHF